MEAKESLSKYNRINLIFPSHNYYPIEIVQGFRSFCQDYAFEYAVLDSSTDINMIQGDVFITVMEDDLIKLLDQILTKKLQIGVDVGLISYNETPIKRLIGQGISTISTDFKQLGISAAELVMSGDKVHIENPFYFTHRPSI
jgi:DNA-binding LacI/PurR family transcriptional regulator